MKPALDLPFAPMEAVAVDELPTAEGWQYEPKWDGFRCIAVRDGDEVFLQSKAGQPLGRYFPEVIESLRALRAKRFAVDGELVVPEGAGLSFDQLLMRIHPAASRVKKLAAEHPAAFIVFDLLASDDDRIVEQPQKKRRVALEKFAAKELRDCEMIRLSPATTDLAEARSWFAKVGGELDGIIAKRLDLAYAQGERAMQKIKNYRSADCVVGGFRYAEKAKVVGSLLLGVYDDAGLLNHVGFCSGLKTSERPALTKKLEALIEPPGFTGRAPGGPSRWSTARSTEWQPLAPKLVVEVSYDHFTGGRFRHGTRLLRWRPDKAPAQCRDDQLRQPKGRLVELLR